MAVQVPVVRKYHVGDHVGLETIRAVGVVVDRRGVVTGLGPDDGSGRYLAEFRGVPEQVHRELVKYHCRCKAHQNFWRQAAKRLKRQAQQHEIQALLSDAERACESVFAHGHHGLGVSSIWYESRELLNCSGKERLPWNVNVSYGTPPPYFDQMPMGRWDPSKAPRYAHGTHLA